MELQELSRYIASEARKIQADLASINNRTGTSVSTQSIESILIRIEDRLIEVAGNTETLVERVPQNLKPLLLEIKTTILERIDSFKDNSTQSNKSGQSFHQGGDGLKQAFETLSPREKKLFQICFKSGLITYRELAEQLDIAPVSAKNIVNRLFQNPEKSRLFNKENMHGVCRIKVAETVQKEILNGHNKAFKYKGNVSSKPAKALKSRF